MTVKDEIKERIRLQDLVAENPAIRLRKSGSSHVGFCPFHHNANTPSFVVWESTQTWKCFGSCNEGGDVYTYVMKQNPSWDFKEAMKYLAGRVGIQLKADDADLKGRISARVNANIKKIAQDLFKKWLQGEKDKEGTVIREPDKEALAYALDRGWMLETLKGEGIGFSGRATAEAFKEMRGAFQLNGIDPLAPEAVMILGFKGDVKAWALTHDLDPKSFGENSIMGFMDTPSLMFAHKFDGVIEYLSARFLPEFEKKLVRKSHNPNAVLAGPRRPYFNRLHKWHHVEGKQKSKRIHLVEGQGDAAAFGQLGEPAMALCGSSWRYLVESGVVDLLKSEYDDICMTVDADMPGETVVTGKNNDFPLTTAFGAMLWVERAPKLGWMRRDGSEKNVKDVSDLTQYFKDEAVELDKQKEEVKKLISGALPIVVEAAAYVGMQEGSLKEDAIQKIAKPLILQMPTTTRLNYAGMLAEKIYPNIKSKTERTILFNKWLGSELKALKDEDDEYEMQEEETYGGWFIDNETGNSGHLVELFYDKRTSQILLAWVHIKDLVNNEREIGSGKRLVLENKILIPPAYDQLIQENIQLNASAIKMATGIGEKFSTGELIKKNSDFYNRYFYMEDKSKFKFCASWSLNTWVYDCFDTMNFLRMRGSAGSGKSDLAYLTGLTSYRFAVTAAVTSGASHVGLSKIYNATTLIDEYDSVMKRDDGTIEGFLKARPFRRIAHAFKMMEVMTPNGKTFVPSNTPIYGATLLTGYKPFQDKGIESRCMTFDMARTDMLTLDKHDFEPGYYPPELEEEAEAIRNACLRWRLETWMPKIELTKEQRKQHKLNDILVSARENQLLRPMKVMAVVQNDMALLEDLFIIGRANYEDELLQLSGSFEAMVLRAALAADIAKDLELKIKPQASSQFAENVKGYADLVKVGKLGKHGMVRYILYKDLGKILNELFDFESIDEPEEDKKRRKKVQSKTAGDICRDAFRMPVQRTGNGFVVVLSRERLDIAKMRLGLDREPEYDPNYVEEKEDVETAKKTVPVQAELEDYVPSADAAWLGEHEADMED